MPSFSVLEAETVESGTNTVVPGTQGPLENSWEPGTGVCQLCVTSGHPHARQEGEDRTLDKQNPSLIGSEGLEEREPSSGVLGIALQERGLPPRAMKRCSLLAHNKLFGDMNAYPLSEVNLL